VTEPLDLTPRHPKQSMRAWRRVNGFGMIRHLDPWEKAVGPQFAAVSRLESCSHGEMTILITGAEWGPILRGMTDKFLERLRPAGVHAIRWIG
jgi:hypothetical protein